MKTKQIQDLLEYMEEESKIQFSKVKEYFIKLSKTSLGKHEADLFMEAILKYIDVVVNISAKRQHREQIKFCRRWFDVIQKVVTEPLQTLFLNRAIQKVFNILLEEDISGWCIKKELLKIFMACIRSVPKEVRYSVTKRLPDINLLKIIDSISTYGDFDFQVILIEAVFYMYGKKNILPRIPQLLPESQELSQHFANISSDTFDEDTRKFLNILNETIGKVFSIICKDVIIGQVKCGEPIENVGGLWVDFNLSEYAVSFYCTREPLIDGNLDDLDALWNLEMFFVDDVDYVQVHRHPENNEAIIYITLTTPCIHSDSNITDDVKRATNIKFVVSYTANKTQTLLSKIIPKMFKHKFRNNFPKVSLGKQSLVYRPLSISVVKRARSNSSRSKSDVSGFTNRLEPQSASSENGKSQNGRRRRSTSSASTRCEVISISDTNSNVEVEEVTAKENVVANVQENVERTESCSNEEQKPNEESQYETAPMFLEVEMKDASKISRNVSRLKMIVTANSAVLTNISCIEDLEEREQIYPNKSKVSCSQSLSGAAVEKSLQQKNINPSQNSDLFETAVESLIVVDSELPLSQPNTSERRVLEDLAQKKDVKCSSFRCLNGDSKNNTSIGEISRTKLEKWKSQSSEADKENIQSLTQSSANHFAKSLDEIITVIDTEDLASRGVDDQQKLTQESDDNYNKQGRDKDNSERSKDSFSYGYDLLEGVSQNDVIIAGEAANSEVVDSQIASQSDKVSTGRKSQDSPEFVKIDVSKQKEDDRLEEWCEKDASETKISKGRRYKSSSDKIGKAGDVLVGDLNLESVPTQQQAKDQDNLEKIDEVFNKGRDDPVEPNQEDVADVDCQQAASSDINQGLKHQDASKGTEEVPVRNEHDLFEGLNQEDLPAKGVDAVEDGGSKIVIRKKKTVCTLSFTDEGDERDEIEVTAKMKKRKAAHALSSTDEEDEREEIEETTRIKKNLIGMKRRKSARVLSSTDEEHEREEIEETTRMRKHLIGMKRRKSVRSLSISDEDEKEKIEETTSMKRKAKDAKVKKKLYALTMKPKKIVEKKSIKKVKGKARKKGSDSRLSDKKSGDGDKVVSIKDVNKEASKKLQSDFEEIDSLQEDNLKKGSNQEDVVAVKETTVVQQMPECVVRLTNIRIDPDSLQDKIKETNSLKQGLDNEMSKSLKIEKKLSMLTDEDSFTVKKEGIRYDCEKMFDDLRKQDELKKLESKAVEDDEVLILNDSDFYLRERVISDSQETTVHVCNVHGTVDLICALKDSSKNVTEEVQIEKQTEPDEVIEIEKNLQGIEEDGTKTVFDETLSKTLRGQKTRKLYNSTDPNIMECITVEEELNMNIQEMDGLDIFEETGKNCREDQNQKQAEPVFVEIEKNLQPIEKKVTKTVHNETLTTTIRTQKMRKLRKSADQNILERITVDEELDKNMDENSITSHLQEKRPRKKPRKDKNVREADDLIEVFDGTNKNRTENQIRKQAESDKCIDIEKNLQLLEEFSTKTVFNETLSTTIRDQKMKKLYKSADQNLLERITVDEELDKNLDEHSVMSYLQEKRLWKKPRMDKSVREREDLIEVFDYTNKNHTENRNMKQPEPDKFIEIETKTIFSETLSTTTLRGQKSRKLYNSADRSIMDAIIVQEQLDKNLKENSITSNLQEKQPTKKPHMGINVKPLTTVEEEELSVKRGTRVYKKKQASTFAPKKKNITFKEEKSRIIQLKHKNKTLRVDENADRSRLHSAFLDILESFRKETKTSFQKIINSTATKTKPEKRIKKAKNKKPNKKLAKPVISDRVMRLQMSSDQSEVSLKLRKRPVYDEVSVFQSDEDPLPEKSQPKINIISDIQLRPKRVMLEEESRILQKKIKTGPVQNGEVHETQGSNMTEQDIQHWMETGSPHCSQAVLETQTLFKVLFPSFKKLVEHPNGSDEYRDALAVYEIVKKYI